MARKGKKQVFYLDHMDKIIHISVKDGMATVDKCPKGCVILIKDYDTQEECTKLADGIEDEMKIFEAQGIGKVYLDGGMYCKIKGVDSTALGIGDSEFVTKEEEVGKYKEAIQYLKSQGAYATKPYLIEDSKDEYVLIEPAYSVYLSHIRDFVRFLRNCGGFEIW